MDQGKIGNFISIRRKYKKLTQKQLADKLLISEKTISKWECGNGLPDVSLMIPLCDILEISVNELLSGSLIEGKNYKENAEANLLKMLEEKEDSRKKIIISIVSTVVGTMVLVFCVMLSIFLEINVKYKLSIVIFGSIIFCVMFINAVLLDLGSGSFECSNCKIKFRPSMKQYLMAPHLPTKRYLKCPKCGKLNYCKHKLLK